MRRVVFLATLFISLPSLQVLAQDSNYWDNQYGTKGELLGGLVVGSPTDLSATFYNPGWIALHTDPSFLLTTLAAEAYRIRLKDGVGNGTNPASTTITTSPSYLAGRFTVGEDRSWQWAYSYLQKVKFKFDATAIRIDSGGQPPPTPSGWLSGESFRQAETNEYWYGVTFARKLKEDTGLGFTPYVVQRTMKSRTQTSAQLLGEALNYAQAYYVDEYDFWHVRILAKIGLAVDKGDLTYGLTVTTPGIALFGSGKVLTTSTISGVDLDQNGEEDPAYLSSDYQEELSSEWTSPLSVAIGASYKSGATGYYLTVEWFNAVKSRKAMKPQDYYSQSRPDELNEYSLTYGAQSLINYGLGIEHTLNPKFSLYGAFRSDYSSVPSRDTANLQVSNWDLWHFSTGASFVFLNMEFTAGLQYSYGNGTNERFINFSLEEDQSVLEPSGTHEITYDRLKVLIGFNLPLGETGS
jgi:hypothetical protein